MDSLKSWKWEDGLVQTSRNFKKSLDIKNDLAMIDATIIVKLQEIEWF